MGLLYTDRSRYLAGLAHCLRRRWHEYEAFPDERGVGGFRLKGRDLFLATGSATHAGLESLLNAATQGPVSRDAARGFIASSVTAYREESLSTGLLGALPPDYTSQMSLIIEEQACLVEGLYWCFYRALLPWLLEEFEIVAVEQEEWSIAGCTCGLADAGELLSHEEKGCDGVVVAARPDFLARRRSDRVLVQFDFKTTGYSLDTREHEHILQVIFGGRAVEKRYGEACGTHYFIGLHKGERREARGEGFKRQSSPLCYGYLRPSAGMLDPGDWRSSYEWEEDGKTRRVSKDYIKTPVWETHFADRAEGISNIEHLVFTQPIEFAGKQVSVLGPSQRPDYIVPRVFAQAVAHEREWAERKALIGPAGDRASLDFAVPASWDCYPFGRACAYQDICFESPGWDRPLDDERWERREAHHSTEGAVAELKRKEE